MSTNDPVNRWRIHGDPARFAEAAAVVRSAQAEEVFGSRFPGEFVMVGLARVLDALAREVRDDPGLGHDVVSAATDLAAHVLAYVPCEGRP
jgi:hypothetical protein